MNRTKTPKLPTPWWKRYPWNTMFKKRSKFPQMDDDLSLDRAKAQFASTIKMLKERTEKLMQTPEGRKALRRDLGALQGIPADQVKLEGYENEH